MQKFHLISRALILNNNHVLLAHQKGADNTFLPGGHIEVGESATTALKRELYEELRVDLEMKNFLGCVEADWEDEKNEANFSVDLIFKATILNENAPLISQENHLEFFWCPVDELEKKNLLPYPLQKLITDYASGKRDVWWASTLPSVE